MVTLPTTTTTHRLILRLTLPKLPSRRLRFVHVGGLYCLTIGYRNYGWLVEGVGYIRLFIGRDTIIVESREKFPYFRVFNISRRLRLLAREFGS
jgi:hypothetical protein